jgi:hypothetical protein
MFRLHQNSPSVKTGGFRVEKAQLVGQSRLAGGKMIVASVEKFMNHENVDSRRMDLHRKDSP